MGKEMHLTHLVDIENGQKEDLIHLKHLFYSMRSLS